MTSEPAVAENEMVQPTLREEVKVPSPMPELSQEEYADLHAKANALLQGDKQITNACLNLLTARRLYNVALQALNRRCDELEQPQLMQQFLADSMQHHSGTEFTRQQLLQSIQKNTIEWVLSEIGAEELREAQVVAAEVIEEEKARRACVMPLPFQPSTDWPHMVGKEAVLPRGITVAVAGPPGLVALTLDAIMAKVLTAKVTPSRPKATVARLVSDLIDHNVLLEKNSQLFHKIGVNRWMNCAQSLRKIQDAMGPFLGILVNNRIDLCLVDDLSTSYELAVGEMPDQYLAGQAQRAWTKWAKETGATVIGGVPVQGSVFVNPWESTTLDASWGQLENYTLLLQLYLEEVAVNKTYKLMVQRHGDPATAMCIAPKLERDMLLQMETP